MKPLLITIAGGSGCGKSTLAYSLMKRFPDKVEVMHFDDYQKEKADIPILHGMGNWDHPDAVDFERLIKDLKSLLRGKPVKLMTKSRYYNPDYEEKGRMPHTLQPKKIIILEGYLALHDKRIRDICGPKVYLDLPLDKGIRRRDKVTYNDEDEYNRLILRPMHKKYVEPTKGCADIIIDIEKHDAKSVQDVVMRKLRHIL